MDLNRKALKRLDELENTVSSRREQRVRNVGFSIHPSFPLRSGNPYTTTTASGLGSLSLMIRLTARVTQIGRVAIRVSGELINFTDFETLGISERVIMLQIRVSNASSITLEAQNGFVGLLEAVQMVLIGDRANLSGVRRDFGADISGNIIGILSGQNDQLFIYSSPVSNLQNFTTRTVGTGRIADIVADKMGGFFVAFRDNSNNFWLNHSMIGGSSRAIRLGGQAIESVAITIVGNMVYVYYVLNNRIYSIAVSQNFSQVSSPIELANERADSVWFVKNASNPMLLFSRNGKVFGRFSVDSSNTASASFGVDISIGASVEGI
ncbi:MAG: hypothetical protein FWE13_02365 [Firmicutes bacterium]|nr:hypothetical protein [Bacillota bacterium]